MATPQSDVEQAALKNYGAGNRFTPNTPFTPEGTSAAAAAAQKGPQGGPSPYALHQQRRGLTLADIRRRNLDEQQALRDEGHLKRYRFLNYSSEDSALQRTTAKKLSTFYCSCCGSTVCVTEVALEDMPQRGTDSAYVLQASEVFHKLYVVPSKRLILRRPSGLEPLVLLLLLVFAAAAAAVAAAGIVAVVAPVADSLGVASAAVAAATAAAAGSGDAQGATVQWILGRQHLWCIFTPTPSAKSNPMPSPGRADDEIPHLCLLPLLLPLEHLLFALRLEGQPFSSQLLLHEQAGRKILLRQQQRYAPSSSTRSTSSMSSSCEAAACLVALCGLLDLGSTVSRSSGDTALQDHP
ncbi:hypothetical protein ACSSS7_004324 [Eimeria intestinalis]